MTPTELIDQLLRKCSTLEHSASLLTHLLSSDCEVTEEGTVRLFVGRQQIERLDGLVISVRAREHAPPHFHVKGGDINATFAILDGTHLTGEINSKHHRAIRFWYPRSRDLLIRTWNETRPKDCPVGPIAE